MRESTKFVLLVTLGLLVGTVLVVSVSCGGSSPTNVVDGINGSGSGVTQSGSTPTVTATPSPAPVGDAPYIEFSRDPKDGSGTMFNPTAHPVTFTIDYFNATDFNKQVPLLSEKYVVDPKSSKALPPARDVLKLTCGLTWDIQIDASTTTHIGHVIFQIVTDKCQQCTWKELEPEIKYSEWGECKAVSTPTTAAACSHSRTKTTIVREQNTCTDEIRIKSSIEITESEPCTCACVEEWIEQEPVVTYGEWSECRPTPTTVDVQCGQTRTKTTVINEKNSCTNEVREKSRKTENESQPCQCACVEEWIELQPEITYGEWSECGPNKDLTCEAECSQSRSKRIIIREENTCTKATRVKSDTTTTETRPCECKKEECKATVPSEPYCENSRPESECEYYGLKFLGKVEWGFWGPKWFGNPPDGTALVIVKAGSCESTGDKMHALYFPPYTPNQMFMSATGKNISHITFCGCE